MILPFLISLYQPPMICTAVDGDTLRGPEIGRVRLLGIDAPEMAGHCRKGRVCAFGHPVQSKTHLAKLVRRGVIILLVTRDRYGRTVAQVYVGRKNIACEQLPPEAYFSDEFKRDAVAQITERGYPVAEVSQRLGVSQHSLYAWKRQLAQQVSGDAMHCGLSSKT